MKRKILMVFALVLVTVVTLGACGKSSGLKQNPSISETVIGNGGISVQKGDYLYFANGLVELDGYKYTDNTWGKPVKGALYRTKIVNSLVEHDEDGFTQNVELVVPKIVGHPNASFYILGDYIYYSTPNDKTNRLGQSLPYITDFFRVNINGTGNKLLYTSSTEDLEAKDWTAYANENKHYIVIKDGEKLVSLHDGKTTELANNVTSVAFYKQDRLANNNQPVVEFMNNYVYYTRSVVESDDLKGATGNILARTKLNKASEEKLSQLNGVNYTLVSLDNGSLYYTKGTQPYNTLFRNILKEDGAFSAGSEMQLTYNDYDKIYIVKNLTSSQANHVVAEKNGAIYLINQQQNNQVTGAKPLVTSNASIMFVYENLVVYLSENILYSIDVRSANPQDTITKINVDDKPIYTTTNTLLDFDGSNIYLFAGYQPEGENATQQYYLNRINLIDNKTEFVGLFENGHIPAKPDNTDKPVDEHEKWIK